VIPPACPGRHRSDEELSAIPQSLLSRYPSGYRRVALRTPFARSRPRSARRSRRRWWRRRPPSGRRPASGRSIPRRGPSGRRVMVSTEPTSSPASVAPAIPAPWHTTLLGQSAAPVWVSSVMVPASAPSPTSSPGEWMAMSMFSRRAAPGRPRPAPTGHRPPGTPMPATLPRMLTTRRRGHRSPQRRGRPTCPARRPATRPPLPSRPRAGSKRRGIASGAPT
jgi:hypothetical protein